MALYAKWWEPRGFLELRRHSRVTTGISAFPLGWPWEAQSSPRVARECHTKGSLSFPSHLVRNRTLAPQLEKTHETPRHREMRAFFSYMA